MCVLLFPTQKFRVSPNSDAESHAYAGPVNLAHYM